MINKKQNMTSFVSGRNFLSFLVYVWFNNVPFYTWCPLYVGIEEFLSIHLAVIGHMKKTIRPLFFLFIDN